jgi:large repetitive protein
VSVGSSLRRRSTRGVFHRLIVVGALAGILVVAPGAAGLPNDDSPPVVIPHYFGTPGTNDWYTSNLTLNWEIFDPDGPILDWDPVGCAPFSITSDHPGTTRTCWAVSAGGRTEVETKLLKVDKTKPEVTSKTPSRPPDKADWYNHELTVTFAGTDNLSGIASCSKPAYSTPDDASASVSGTCTDLAGNQSPASSFGFKYDGTKPQVTSKTPSRQPDANGWYNQLLTVTYAGTDNLSGIASCSKPAYSTPDDASASVSGTCTDQAGNQSPASSFGFKYDGTKPQVTDKIPTPAPNANGWFKNALSVEYKGSDNLSGVDTCSKPTYNEPDSANASVSGTCTDKAGNESASSSFLIKYDATAPSNLGGNAARPPNANGWYNHLLTVTFAGSDNLSGIDTCSKPAYSGPDSTTASVSGTCTDLAGNQSPTSSFGFKYDGTKPQVTDKIPSRPPNADGWYKDPLSVKYKGSDNLSGIASCAELSYNGPESANASVSGTCVDSAGNESVQSSFGFKYDATGPAVIPSPAREPDSNGWYNHSLSVSFAGSDGASGLASCAPSQSYEGPDSVFAVVTGTCTDNAGNVGLGSLALKYDSTAPQVVGASPDRAPDGNGWYNHALTVSFLGSDATSQIEACTAAGYAGPDNPSASVSGSCRDRAGNPSGASPFAFKYDASAPALVSLTVKAGNRGAVLRWVASPDTSLVEIVRTAGARGLVVTVYRGTGRSFTDTRLENGVRYRYTLKGYDDARNVATKEAAATPTAPLISPRAGATVSAPPQLVWKAVEKATYYNVQVWRRGKIFSAWPTGTSLHLKRTWKYAGRSYRLSPGRYNWYVWPGYGRRAQQKFGPLLGSSSFVVKAPRR